MENIKFTKGHYNQMIVINEDYREISFEDVESMINEGAEIVAKNKGFANLDSILDEAGMVSVSAFINFRTAKEDLGEYVEEIDS